MNGQPRNLLTIRRFEAFRAERCPKHVYKFRTGLRLVGNNLDFIEALAGSVLPDGQVRRGLGTRRLVSTGRQRGQDEWTD